MMSVAMSSKLDGGAELEYHPNVNAQAEGSSVHFLFPFIHCAACEAMYLLIIHIILIFYWGLASTNNERIGVFFSSQF